jgi:hypothetical protein
VCDDYVDDNFWLAVRRGNIVIWLGDATKGNLDSWTPARVGLKSYISALDFDSPLALADHVHHLDGNDTAYGEYLLWKRQPASAINPALLHRWGVSRPEVGGCALCDKVLQARQLDPAGEQFTGGQLPEQVSVMGSRNISCSAKGVANAWGEALHAGSSTARLVADIQGLPGQIWEWRRGEATVASWAARRRD